MDYDELFEDDLAGEMIFELLRDPDFRSMDADKLYDYCAAYDVRRADEGYEAMIEAVGDHVVYTREIFERVYSDVLGRSLEKDLHWVHCVDEYARLTTLARLHTLDAARMETGELERQHHKVESQRCRDEARRFWIARKDRNRLAQV